MEPLLLLKVVQGISLVADPDQPARVSQRAFDAAREQMRRDAASGKPVPIASDLLASTPLARDIARKLKRPWPVVLKIAHESSKTHSDQIREDEARRSQDWLTAELIAYVLKIAAGRLGRSTLTPAQYEAEREKLLAVSNSRWMHGRRLRLPTARQIVTFTRAELYETRRTGTPKVGTWDRALDLAGLERNQRSKRPREQPLLLPELLERYYDANGVQPTSRRLLGFTRTSKLAYSPIRSSQVWRTQIAAWIKSREERGLPAPPAPPPTTDDERRILLMRFPTKKRRQSSPWHNKEKCINILVRYLKQLPPGKRSTLADYTRWAKQQQYPAPGLTALRKHGTWNEMRDLAHQRMLAA